jgi:hypothetical protein
MDANGFINTSANFIANLHIFRSKPAAHTLASQIGMEPFGEVVIFAGVVTVDKGIAPLTAAPNRTGRFPFIRLFSVWSLVIDTLCAIFCMSHIMAMSMKNTLVI